MKKFIKKSISFIFFFIIITSVPIKIISQFDNLDKSFTKNNNIVSLNIVSNYKDLDILFLGNSYCYSGIQPKILESIGIDSYALGIATAGVGFYRIIINDYLSHATDYPKNIFILLSPITFSSKSDGYVDYPIHRYLKTPIKNSDIVFNYKYYNQTNSDKMMVPSNMIKKTMDLFLINRRSFKKGLINIYRLITNELSTENIILIDPERGFIGNNRIASDGIIFDDKIKYQSLIKDKFQFDKILELEKIVESIKLKGIKVKFFQIPTNKLEESFNIDYLNNYKLSLEYLSKNTEIINIDKLDFNKNHYRDLDHLNTYGAELVAKKMIEHILMSENI